MTAQELPATLGQRLRQARVARGLSNRSSPTAVFEAIRQSARARPAPANGGDAQMARRAAGDRRVYLATGSMRGSASASRASSRPPRPPSSRTTTPRRSNCSPRSRLADAPSAEDLELRALLAESWARMYIGEMREALPLLARAREIVEGSVFSTSTGRGALPPRLLPLPPHLGGHGAGAFHRGAGAR